MSPEPEDEQDNTLKDLETLIDEAYENDEAIQNLRKSVDAGDRRVPSQLIGKGYKKNIQDFSVKESQVWLKDTLVVPNYQPLRLRLLQDHHKTLLAGHPGPKAMYKDISKKYWWAGQREDVTRFAKSCHHCRRYKPYSEQKQDLLKPLPVPQQKWLNVSLDFVEKLPTCIKKNREYQYYLVIVDRLIKEGCMSP